MFQSFRQASAWVHTWFGLVLGFVLVVVFFFGSLSVFDREIDRWATPASRFDPQPMPSFDRVLRPALERLQPDKASIESARPRVNGDLPKQFDTVQEWSAYTTHRDPVLSVVARYEAPNPKQGRVLVTGRRTIDPRTGQWLPGDRLNIGSQFFFQLHFNLTFRWKDIGYWTVGFAALMMIVALITGVVMHRKIFREFFTLRFTRNGQRSVLDLHNMTGVMALPFHFFFALTGLLIFAGHYFPVANNQLKPLQTLSQKMEEQETGLPQKRAGVAAPLASVDAMVADAQRRWATRGMAGEVGRLALFNVGDANGYVSILRAGTDRVANISEGIHYKASTGALLREDPPQTTVGGVGNFLTGLHRQHFRHWLLRWLYVLGGLTGVACIATGLIFFVKKRKRHHALAGGQGTRLADAMAVTTITGTLIATMSILIANRLLPDAMPPGWPPRDSLERWLFWGGWALTMAHALVRSAPVALGKANPAWREQCLAIAAMAPAAVLLNWITTGDHLVRTISIGYWPVAGVDLALLATATVAAYAAHRLGRVRTRTDRAQRRRTIVSEAVNA